MAQAPGGHTWWLYLEILLLQLCLVSVMAEERGECREQEYRDQYGNCVPCRRCEAGQELSKECGFGYGEEARCVPCRASRFKEDRGVQKCKPCLHCALLNRLQKTNCSSTRNAVCGDCLPGFYRRTKLSGFQDVECVPCGESPPPHEPHCSGRVNLVPLPSTVTSPRDVALAAVICSALATVLLALFILCVIYCKRQLLEKKPASLRSPDAPYSGEELSCLDRRRVLHVSARPCCRCRPAPGPVCDPAHLIPSLCCEDLCSLGHEHVTFSSQRSLSERHVTSSPRGGDPPAVFSGAWPLVDRSSAHPWLRCPPPTDISSLKEEDDEEEKHSSSLLHAEAMSVIPLDRDNTLLSQHHVSAEDALVCP